MKYNLLDRPTKTVSIIPFLIIPKKKVWAQTDPKDLHVVLITKT